MTSKFKHRLANDERAARLRRRGVRISLLAALQIFSVAAWAQSPPSISPQVAAQLILQPQPAVDNSIPLNVTATAEFDPPTIAVGEKVFYRVSVTAPQNSIQWPDQIAAPPELQFGASARGQLTQPDGTKFQPVTSFVYEVTATKAGRFTVPEMILPVGWPPVEVPAATLEVTENKTAPSPGGRQLLLEFSETNLFVGQPFHVRVVSAAAPGAPVEGLRDVQFSGGAIFADKLSTRLSSSASNINGQNLQTFIYETTATPMKAGAADVSAQAFTVPLFSAGPVSITAGGGPIVLGGAAQVKPTLLLSKSARLNVRPLPTENELPGFTGAMGQFTAERAILSTNRLRVGEPLRLRYTFIPGTNLTRFVPPEAPRSRDWQIIAGKPGENLFTLIPFTDEATNTPAIPFCAFDPVAKKFYDLTIPAMPVTIIGEGLPVQLTTWDAEQEKSAPLKLAPLANAPGKSVASLKPLQTQGWFVAAQLLPLLALFLLWRWDERRRFLEAHPDVVRRLQAKRALRREKKLLAQAVTAGDAENFLKHSVAAMRVAVAPHFPADAQALVGSDVLTQISDAERVGKMGATVQKLFAAEDAKFGKQSAARENLLAAHGDVAAVLEKLEEKL